MTIATILTDTDRKAMETLQVTLRRSEEKEKRAREEHIARWQHSVMMERAWKPGSGGRVTSSLGMYGNGVLIPERKARISG